MLYYCIYVGDIKFDKGEKSLFRKYSYYQVINAYKNLFVKDIEYIDTIRSNILKGKKLVNGFYNKYLLVKKHLRFGLYKKIDVAINCCHGLNGEDGTLSGLLELNNIPYVGSGVVASAVGMDKVIMKDVFVANDIPCVKYVSFYKNEYDNNRQDILLNSEVKLGYPIIVKPANLGSSEVYNITDKYFDNIIESVIKGDDVDVPKTKEEILNLINENEGILIRNGIEVSDSKKEKIASELSDGGKLDKIYKNVRNSVKKNLSTKEIELVKMYDRMTQPLEMLKPLAKLCYEVTFVHRYFY